MYCGRDWIFQSNLLKSRCAQQPPPLPIENLTGCWKACFNSYFNNAMQMHWMNRKLKWQMTKRGRVYSNLYSQAVTQLTGFTSAIRRELVHSRWYGRIQRIYYSQHDLTLLHQHNFWHGPVSVYGRRPWFSVGFDLATFLGQQENPQSSELLLWYTPLKKCIQAV